jgi:type II secretory ATPase GspE/PulE/Tfp pilus assembly ATPase PilB-like protein
MAQRLVRILCPHCKKEMPLEGELKTRTEKIVASIVDKAYTKDLGPLSKQWVSGGCDKCNMTGYKGRIGIYEAIFKDQKIEEVIVKSAGEREIKVVAIAQGFLDMKQDGILKVVKGVTSFEELSRVIDIEEEA